MWLVLFVIKINISKCKIQLNRRPRAPLRQSKSSVRSSRITGVLSNESQVAGPILLLSSSKEIAAPLQTSRSKNQLPSPASRLAPNSFKICSCRRYVTSRRSASPRCSKSASDRKVRHVRDTLFLILIRVERRRQTTLIILRSKMLIKIRTGRDNIFRRDEPRLTLVATNCLVTLNKAYSQLQLHK